METKIGTLQSVRTVGVIFGDLEIKIDWQKFYNRIKCSEIPEDIEEQTGQKTKVDYEEEITPLNDWIVDRVPFFSFEIPRHYNQILKIEVNNFQ